MRKFLLVMALCVPSGPAFAQTSGSITGEVKDQSGAGSERGGQRHQFRDKRDAVDHHERRGNLQFPRPDSGNIPGESRGGGLHNCREDEYRTTGAADGAGRFQPLARQATQTIEVSASGGLLSTENATVGTVIEEQRISELPLNGPKLFQPGRLGAQRCIRLLAHSTGQRTSRRYAVHAHRLVVRQVPTC